MKQGCLLIACAALLAGCASVSPDGGFDRVRELAQARTGVAPVWQREAEADEAVAQRIDALLAQPLSADAAAELALLNQPGLQMRLQSLGLADVERVRVSTLANPLFHIGRLAGGGALEIERSVGIDLLGLLSLPARKRIADQRFAMAQLQAVADIVHTAAEARLACFDAVAAQAALQYRQQVAEAAEAASELARRMREAGHFDALSQLREQVFHAEAMAELERARHEAQAARERLVRALGLHGEQLAFTLPAQLPPLPAAVAPLGDEEQRALAQRLDVLAARQAAEATAKTLGLTRVAHWVELLEVGVQDQRDRGEAAKRGPTLDLALPLFDFDGAQEQAEAVYLQALHRAAQVAVDARSQVREAHSAWRSAHAVARRYADEVVPLQQRIGEQNRLRYNAMQISVFELLADAREQVRGVAAALQAQRDYWVADTRLQLALNGAGPGSATPMLATAPAPSFDERPLADH